MSSSGGPTCSGDDDSGEDEESSSSQLMKGPDDTLNGNVCADNREGQCEPLVDSEMERKARDYFLQGVQYEENGQLFDAILMYKRAVSIVPDIEARTFMYTQSKSCENQPVEPQGKGNKNKEEDNNGNDLDPDFGEELSNCLEFRFSAMGLGCCQQDRPQKGVHLSSLPMEVLSHILKWVVSSDLDLKSLENCSEVCRGFYLAARSNIIWKSICLRTWNVESSPRDIKAEALNTTWRNVFFTRPRAQLHGCYIAKMTYLREGERGFQDNEFYRSWHSVQHYRLIRFLAGGRLLMITTPEDPATAVKFLSTRQGKLRDGIMKGSYTTVGNTLQCIIKKKGTAPKLYNQDTKKGRNAARMPKFTYEVPEQDLVFDLEIGGKRNRRLVWKKYSFITRYLSGSFPEHLVDIDLTNQNCYPPLVFSPVRSYLTDVEGTGAL